MKVSATYGALTESEINPYESQLRDVHRNGAGSTST